MNSIEKIYKEHVSTNNTYYWNWELTRSDDGKWTVTNGGQG